MVEPRYERQVRDFLERMADEMPGVVGAPPAALRKARGRLARTVVATVVAASVIVVAILGGTQLLSSEGPIPGPVVPPPSPGEAPVPTPSPSAPDDASSPSAATPVIDATVTIRENDCSFLAADDRIEPGRLSIRFVNESPWFLAWSRWSRDVGFMVQRVTRDTTLNRIRHDMPPISDRQWVVWLGNRHSPRASVVWTSPRALTEGTWAIGCWKDEIGSPIGFMIVNVGVAGPFTIG